MNNAFGLHHLWTQGDFVTHFVAFLLLLMSIVTWVILISRLWGLRNIKRLKSELDSFWRARSYDEGLSHLSNQVMNPFFMVARTGHEASA
ncbi:MAG: MotA/TolQ/ExbB proton channel family protein, partial [Burkholderiaceae bacterium]|nr:MotA/TolQ/ExbB proton channel family protein [Burkholderiaceae bacterium]